VAGQARCDRSGARTPLYHAQRVQPVDPPAGELASGGGRRPEEGRGPVRGKCWPL
jgi:hypothetical protein